MKSSSHASLVQLLLRLFVMGGPLRWLFGIALVAVVAVSLWRPEGATSLDSHPSQHDARLPAGSAGSAGSTGSLTTEESRSELDRWDADERIARSESGEVGDSRLVQPDRRSKPEASPRSSRDSSGNASSNSSRRDADRGDQRARSLPGGLKAESNGTLVSSAGLLYTRGSAEGHRLQHVLGHSQDRPDRPGFHGVFAETDPDWIVKLLDEAYQQALDGRRTRRRQEDTRTIFTVDLGRPIGYIGGQTGNKRGRPETRSLRLVLEGKRVITAYPILP